MRIKTRDVRHHPLAAPRREIAGVVIHFLVALLFVSLVVECTSTEAVSNSATGMRHSLERLFG